MVRERDHLGGGQRCSVDLKLQDFIILILILIYIYIYIYIQPLIGEGNFLLISEVFKTIRMSKGINNAYITLIPKISGANTFIDFRPISLVNEVYKIIVKLLSLRLRIIINQVISDSQFAFISKR